VSERAGATERELVEQNYVLECIDAALAGEPVSDFGLSFPIVRRAAELRQTAGTLLRAFSVATCFRCGRSLMVPECLQLGASCAGCDEARAAIRDAEALLGEG
jgi:hypothetical protein